MVESSWYMVRTNGVNRKSLRIGTEEEPWKANTNIKAAPFAAVVVNEPEPKWIESVRLTAVQGVESVTARVLVKNGKVYEPRVCILT
jgi:hypothetical protein